MKVTMMLHIQSAVYVRLLDYIDEIRDLRAQNKSLRDIREYLIETHRLVRTPQRINVFLKEHHIS